MVGDLEIFDSAGDYWDTYNIAIKIPVNFPFGIPVLMELDKKIPNNIDRHIINGVCCVDIPHKLIKRARKGLLISDFIKEKVRPFLANQIYFDKKECFAGEEYKHGSFGVIQFYEEDLDLNNPILIIAFLENILSKNVPGRNKLCICESKKFKDCHLETVRFLESLGTERLEKDLELFKEVIRKSA